MSYHFKCTLEGPLGDGDPEQHLVVGLVGGVVGLTLFARWPERGKEWPEEMRSFETPRWGFENNAASWKSGAFWGKLPLLQEEWARRWLLWDLWPGLSGQLREVSILGNKRPRLVRRELEDTQKPHSALFILECSVKLDHRVDYDLAFKF